MSQRKFEDKWDLDAISSCGEGIELLRAFSEAYPEAYKFVRPSDFAAPLNNPAFAGIAEWEAFAEHHANCHECSGRRPERQPGDKLIPF